MPPSRFSLLAAALLLGACASAPNGGAGYPERMAREHAGQTPTANPASEAAPRQEVVGEEVVYGTVDGQMLRGYLARPANAPDSLPALIVIHEWWGLNDNIRAMTRRLAGEGYQALAVDLYGGETASEAQRARQLVQEVMQNPDAGIRNLQAAADYLRGRGAARLGTIGWCFGGAWSLQAALEMPERVDAAVVFYGDPETDSARLARLQAPLLGLYGGQDHGIPVDTVRRMEQMLREQGKQVTIHIYPDASHAFANPSGPAYNAEAAGDAWQRTVAFLEQHLKGGAGGAE